MQDLTERLTARMKTCLSFDSSSFPHSPKSRSKSSIIHEVRGWAWQARKSRRDMKRRKWEKEDQSKRPTWEQKGRRRREEWDARGWDARGMRCERDEMQEESRVWCIVRKRKNFLPSWTKSKLLCKILFYPFLFMLHFLHFSGLIFSL